MTTPISGDIVDLIRVTTRLEAKIDHFLQGQTQMRTELDQIKEDVAAIKSEAQSQKAYFKGVLALLGIAWTGLTLFVVPYIQQKLGL